MSIIGRAMGWPEPEPKEKKTPTEQCPACGTAGTPEYFKAQTKWNYFSGRKYVYMVCHCGQKFDRLAGA